MSDGLARPDATDQAELVRRGAVTPLEQAQPWAHPTPPNTFG